METVAASTVSGLPPTRNPQRVPNLPRWAAAAKPPSPHALVDAELLSRYVAGERAAARPLHAHYYPVAAAFLRKLGVRAEEIEDACQEVFLQFFRYLSSFRGDAELTSWLYRLCVT